MTAPFDLQALAKLPQAALRLLDIALDHRSLDDTLQRHRGPALERKIAFPDFVRLIADAPLGHSAPSAHQTFRRGIENDTLEAGESPMVPALVARVRDGAHDRPRLWIADRAFCDSKTLPQLVGGRAGRPSPRSPA